MEDSDYQDSDVSYMSDDCDSVASSLASDQGLGFAEEAPERSKSSYSLLNENQVKEEMQHAVSEVASVLSTPDDEAAAVLRLCKWDINHANEAWFMDNDAVRSKLGIPETPSPAPASKETTCSICFESLPTQKMMGAACQHLFCKSCWGSYAAEAIANGPAVLGLRCPIPKCGARVPMALLMSVLDEDKRSKLNQYELRSFVETNPHLKWCPAPGCEHAVHCHNADGGAEPMDITCNCGCTFCFACYEEGHRPVDCTTVKTWLVKNSAESENMNWILANTKPCPKCQRPIEKNQGCMHMTCSQCKYEFCWLCNGKWKDHGERTGGYYACNRYEVAWKKGDYNDEHKRRENAKNSLERYMHYYERYSAHDRARKKAQEDLVLHSEDSTMMEKLSELTKTPTSQLKFITDAWSQVVDCRRVLKWTYAYGYYKFDDVCNREIERQKEFFEFLQGDAEGALERLHEEAETSVRRFVDKKSLVSEFGNFQMQLKGLTVVTRTFFDKFVSQLEQGFDSMKDEFVGEAAGKVTGSAAHSAGQGAQGSSNANNSHAPDLRTMPPPETANRWSCHACTFSNDMSRTSCAVCQHPKPSS
mmetsp:Transcript_2487/g.6456  ORF Transcript_2487/g.6456 Transcript_2487/m.6456 type:complete len:589 (+) Transcript_2487:139-1905(+)